MTRSRLTGTLSARTEPDAPQPGEVAQTPGDGKRRDRFVVAAIVIGVIIASLAVNTGVTDAETAPAASTDTIAVDGTALYVRQDGPPAAPAVVLIHGLGSSTAAWDAITPALARSYRVIRVDLLGHGRSAKPAGDAYSIPNQARLVGDVLTSLGVTHAVVVGHSTGGYVATALAEQHPSLVTALGLIDTGPSMSAFISSGSTGNLLTTAVVGQLIWRLRTDAILRKAASSAFSRPGFEIPQRMIDDLNGMTYHALTATSRGSDEFLSEPVPRRLMTFGKPILVLYGADDHRWSPSAFAEYRVVPGTWIEAIPGVGHSPMMEDPGRTSSLLLAFLGSMSTP